MAPDWLRAEVASKIYRQNPTFYAAVANIKLWEDYTLAGKLEMCVYDSLEIILRR